MCRKNGDNFVQNAIFKMGENDSIPQSFAIWYAYSRVKEIYQFGEKWRAQQYVGDIPSDFAMCLSL